MHTGHTTAADRLSVNLSIINMIMITLNPKIYKYKSGFQTLSDNNSYIDKDRTYFFL